MILSSNACSAVDQFDRITVGKCLIGLDRARRIGFNDNAVIFLIVSKHVYHSFIGERWFVEMTLVDIISNEMCRFYLDEYTLGHYFDII